MLYPQLRQRAVLFPLFLAQVLRANNDVVLLALTPLPPLAAESTTGLPPLFLARAAGNSA
jgi:hypothetical protein